MVTDVLPKHRLILQTYSKIIHFIMPYKSSSRFNRPSGLFCAVKKCFKVTRRRHRLTQLLTLMTVLAACLCQRKKTTTGTTTKSRFTFKPAVPDRFKARASMRTLTTKKLTSITTPTSVYFENGCYYIYYHCLRYERTGMMCIRGPYWQYKTVESGCHLHYLNCIERYDIWKIAYMGECFVVQNLTSHYDRYPYNDDYFLDAYYVVPEDHAR